MAYSTSRIAKLFSGKNFIVLILVAIAFYSLNSYRNNNPVLVSSTAPDMTLITAGGEEFRLHQIHIPKVVIFYSERSWGANNIYPTRYASQMPYLKFLQTEGLAQVVIVIKGVDTPEKLRAFQAKKGYDYLEGISYALPDQSVAKAYGVSSWPHTFVLDSNHKVRSEMKILSADSVRKAIANIR